MSKRIMKEIQEIQNDSNVCIEFLEGENNIRHLRLIIIGPNDTIYAGGIFVFDVKYPEDYPFKPPTILFESANCRLHPNLYQSPRGKVCLTILGTWAGSDTISWAPSMTLTTVYQSILGILHDNPISCEPLYYETSPEHHKAIEYSIGARYLTLRHTVIGLFDWIKNFTEKETNFIRTQYEKNISNYEKHIEYLRKYNKVSFNSMHFNITIDMELLEQTYKLFLHKLGFT